MGSAYTFVGSRLRFSLRELYDAEFAVVSSSRGRFSKIKRRNRAGRFASFPFSSFMEQSGNLVHFSFHPYPVLPVEEGSKGVSAGNKGVGTIWLYKTCKYLLGRFSPNTVVVHATEQDSPWHERLKLLGLSLHNSTLQEHVDILSGKAAQYVARETTH